MASQTCRTGLNLSQWSPRGSTPLPFTSTMTSPSSGWSTRKSISRSRFFSGSRICSLTNTWAWGGRVRRAFSTFSSLSRQAGIRGGSGCRVGMGSAFGNGGMDVIPCRWYGNNFMEAPILPGSGHA